MAKYAVLAPKHAGLETEFGRQWAEKLFGAEAIASLPIRTVGKNKGHPKGFVIWRKAIVAGWCREVYAPLAVGGFADAWIGAGMFSNRSDALVGKWAGRMQPLAGAKVMLFGGAERMRAADEVLAAQDRANYAADRAAAWAAEDAALAAAEKNA